MTDDQYTRTFQALTLLMGDAKAVTTYRGSQAPELLARLQRLEQSIQDVEQLVRTLAHECREAMRASAGAYEAREVSHAHR